VPARRDTLEPLSILDALNTDVLVVAVAMFLAITAFKATQWLPVPAPALLLIAAAVASDLFPSLGIDIVTVERIGVVALIVILLDGGMHVGWRRFRGSALPIAMLGVVGTFVTAVIVAFAAHYLLDFSWITSWMLGAALAPTDPAVMFSVLGNREVGGRSGTILEGESGANDPVGIALMIGMIEYATSGDRSTGVIAREFVLQMSVGLVVGLVGGWLLILLMQHQSLPREGLYAIRVLVAGGIVYGVAAELNGSGFLAVFILGLLIGDVHAPYKTEIERFHTSLATLAEIAVFVALGLAIVGPSDLWDDLPNGLALALILAFVARPVAVFLLLQRQRLRRNEKLFIAWGGLKGAVPILLAAFALVADVDDSLAIYNIVFVVVAFSVLVQGSTIPYVARRLGIPMRVVEPEPWDVSIRLREPGHLQRYTVGPSSRVVGSAIRDLPLGERAWVSFVVQDGQARQARGSHVFRVGDEVHVLGEPEDERVLKRLFEGLPVSSTEAQAH
jgi:cell volume regulation protein A